MTTDWIFRVGNGSNFIASESHKIWGTHSKNKAFKHFKANVKQGDRMWFVTCNSHGKILAVATYRSHNKRDIGELIDITMSNMELGWSNKKETDGNWDTEIHYSDLYWLNHCELLTHIKSPLAIRKYDEKCRVDLAVEYSYIVRYSKITSGYVK
jgi:hypothetical protein